MYKSINEVFKFKSNKLISLIPFNSALLDSLKTGGGHILNISLFYYTNNELLFFTFRFYLMYLKKIFLTYNLICRLPDFLFILPFESNLIYNCHIELRNYFIYKNKSIKPKHTAYEI